MIKKENCSPHGWTIDNLEKHITSRINVLEASIANQDSINKERFDSAKEAVAFALASADKALSKAEAASERRFEGLNEFRSALSDQAANLLPRSEFTVQHKSLEDRVAINSTRISNIETLAKGKGEGIGMVGVITLGAMAGIASLVSVATLLINIFRH